MNILNQLINSAYATDVIGTIDLPAGIPKETSQTTDIISALIRFIVVVGGVFALWQLLSGGFQFISSGGDKGKLAEAQNKITMSLVGLVIIAASFIIIAIISKVLFDDFGAILAPKLQSI
ncbi:hypothetical protein A3K29_00980 [Candidatus Collierbacteria bacterium RIFOXYB2_FULL_46_14]|uniref:Uncharacterized protein n=1 Tax=Candidatus Collierbacteria bacterium GW2011_GWA2_46_26 TaxID=1618381 RepID=A0A0G1SIZ7_9BACT|nr:MAG: hypothetical protein UW29_C0003G0027 [Candidatus Collierbacteria bacterium GW2011_GWC2_44_13]KKU33285.1 MAG: hypothetical protein UX47_C0005G0087 [Candidatus Collierbacteria bacterium GW2011_GWA2_46_26]OGD72705.1 MAG: hypothetical protein A3K29_00980 [Candidatus Collierbacteria bacterium RIFOXYB2_FULL_46_14]OGD75747.1 MAG: hypothetical protein A3K43_00980 [Candidatus Collierbacteria bacterium RIFOXYA2_FULL_46_20]OGD77083.1 MAG: hypothetical protein A3K39_00980 [Candidatus Collierbacteri